MHKLILIVCTFAIGVICAFSQTVPPPPPAASDTTAPVGWMHALVAGLTMTQVSFTDWAEGGENALSYTLNADGKSELTEGVSDWTSTYKLAFGQTRLGDQGIRKTDDLIDLSTVYTYKLDVYVNPYALATLRTQFAKGFSYNVGGTGSDLTISQFFDPAYLTQGVGVGYQPTKEFKIRLGLGLREVLTNKFNQYTDDPTTPEIEKTTVNGGLQSISNVEWQWEDNVLFLSQLELFAPFKTMDQIIVRSTSTVTAKVNKYVTTIFNLQLINERRITPRTQVKETISLGITYTIF
jgi:hypothetical protein